ncbi:MAG: acyl-CoA desaturase [Chloroflexi bacterium]|nr:acyl-CoA desaturase [Chloroflexota bacterium]MDA1271871.1 acyl-CoA desaturase [Chloroflexota bacterium]
MAGAAVGVSTDDRVEADSAEPIIRQDRDREYLDLKRRVTNAGLLDRQYLYYAWKIPSVAAMIAASVAVLIIFSGTLWIQMLNAVFLALVFTNLGFMGHDSGHRQIFKSVKRNDWVLLAVGFLTGMTPSWWQDKHNTHHRAPNQLEIDGDIEVSLFAFTHEQAVAMRGIGRLTVRYQAFLFYPLLVLTAISLLFGGIAYQIRKERMRYPIAEPVLVVAGLAAYLGLIFFFLGPWHGALFIVVHRALGGVYMGSVFAPNHKGMPILEKEEEMDYLHQQVLTARNVEGSPIADFWYGGLNYQIEHHLFPNMPRNNLKKAQVIVQSFCEEKGIPYHQTGVWQSNKEILSFLHEVSAPLRRKPA